MKTIPSIIALLLLFSPLSAQQTGQPVNPAVPGGTSRPSATTDALGLAENPGAPGADLGTGTVAPASPQVSNEFAIGLLSEEAEQDLHRPSHRIPIRGFGRAGLIGCTAAANA